MLSFITTAPAVAPAKPVSMLRTMRTFRQKLQRYVVMWIAFWVVTTSVATLLRFLFS